MCATIMLRREFLNAVGGYELGRRMADDLELFLRLLADTPVRFANLPEVLMLYRRHELSKSVKYLAEAQSMRHGKSDCKRFS